MRVLVANGSPLRFSTSLPRSANEPPQRVQVINCGHVAPRLLQDATVVTPELTPGVPLGLAELAVEPTTVGWFAFPPGSTLLPTTDGLTEARDADGSFCPVTERLGRRVTLSPTEPPRALYDDARAFAGGGSRHDDVAILSVRRSPYR